MHALRCTVRVQDQAKEGCGISYDDGRPGHHDVRATVLEVLAEHGMLVQFDDRADTTCILFSNGHSIDSIIVVSWGTEGIPSREASRLFGGR